MKTKTESIFECTSPFDNVYQGKAERKLFVCSAGLLRSATAAAVAIKLGYNARACGSEHYALIPLSVNLILWAKDGIYFVNPYNFESAKENFDGDILDILKERAIVWDIEDCFDFMDKDLVAHINNYLVC